TPGQAGAQPGQQPGQQTGNAFSLGNPLQSQAQPLTGAVIGGNIIGVGSKVKEPSLKVYEGGDTYEQWEFIWNPMQQGALPVQQVPANPNGPPAPAQPQQQAVPGGQPQPGGPPPPSPAPGM